MTFRPFTLSTASVKAGFRPKISKYRRNLAQNGSFGAEAGVNVFWFRDPEKAHPCTEPRLLTHFSSMSVVASNWLYVIVRPPKNSRVNNLVREVAHARKQNALSDLDEILQAGR